MGRIGRWMCLAVALSFLALPLACTQFRKPNPSLGNSPLVRVQILGAQDQVMLSASEPPTVFTTSNPQPRRAGFPANTPVPLVLTPTGWKLGVLELGSGTLTIEPQNVGTVSINGKPYRGKYRFVPAGSGFDVINDVDVDSYLKSVIPREMLARWSVEAFKAQAIVARTYALYEAKTSPGKTYDLFDDTRSQVYGGIADESEKSRKAVDETAGVVVAYGPAGQEKIFKAYFSACCGGITQSAADAFGVDYIEPLSDQNVHDLCSASPKFTWGPIVVSKDELTRRVKLWGERQKRSEKEMSPISRIDIQFVNRWGRPTRFVISDSRGTRYSLSSEELRTAVNTDGAAGTKLFSSFVKIINEPDAVRFVEGRGHGHGVGMCQYCAEARAEKGMRHEDIVISSFPRARLVRAY